MKKIDVVIIGGGPAGIAAAISAYVSKIVTPYAGV